jgi:hypothetical protein
MKACALALLIICLANEARASGLCLTAWGTCACRKMTGNILLIIFGDCWDSTCSSCDTISTTGCLCLQISGIREVVARGIASHNTVLVLSTRFQNVERYIYVLRSSYLCI